MMHYIEYIIVKTFYEILRRMPFGFGKYLASFLRFLIKDVFRYRISTASENLRAAFPDLSENGLKTLLNDSYKHFSQLWVEILQTWRLNKAYFEKNAKIYNWNLVEEAIKEQKGLILLTAHFGGYEYPVHYCALMLQNVYAIMKKVRNKYTNDLIVKIRESSTCRMIYSKSALKNGLKILKEGNTLAIVTDQDAGKNGIFVNFLERAASSAVGPAIFHLKTGAPMVYCLGVRESFGKLSIHFERIPDHISNNINDESIRAITEAHTDILEKWVRKIPAQYFWTHRRWKTQSTESH